MTHEEPFGRSYRGGAGQVDRTALEHALRQRVDGEIRFTDGDRALYATDASNYRQIPLGVVVPRSVEALAEAVRVCAEHDAPLTHRGGGTALAGQTCNTAVILDSSKYCNRILSVDPDRRLAVVEPGVVLDDLQRAARPHGLRFGPDPSTHSRCTIGGMIGNNSCGVHSLAYGRTVDNVEALDILTYDGLEMTVGATSTADLAAIRRQGGRRADILAALHDIAEHHGPRIRQVFPDIPRRVSGYNLVHLLRERGCNLARALVGSEGTCVTVLRAHLNLRPEPLVRALVVAGFKDICRAADEVPGIRDFQPLGCEGIDNRLTQYMRKKAMHPEELKLLPDGCAWLLIPMGGKTWDEACGRANDLLAWLRGRDAFTAGCVITDEATQGRVWEVRESGLGATAFVPGQERDTWPGWEDSAVAPERLGEYLRALLALYDRYGYDASVYGHFGEGLVHTRIDFGLRTRAEVDTFRAFMEDAARLVVGMGGSLSGEHGDGQARGELLPLMFGDDLMGAMEAFKHAWDPRNRMNPGKLVHPRPLDMDLRLGPRFHPPDAATLKPQFAYAESDNSLVRALSRCVGVGKCRQMHGGTMCPSYRGTHEEKHSTRGRARMLQEMMQGDPLTGGWDNREVWDALDLCLGCKACKRECPVDVDMATYKAEFAHHYFKTHWRPRAAWSMGQIHRWARLAAWAPGLANATLRVPGVTPAIRAVAGIHRARALPTFARPTFRRSWRGPVGETGPRVVLLADTFNDHFTPAPLHAAADVLEAAGCRVELPPRGVCCGRPLFDFGFLDQARRTLRHLIGALRGPVAEGAVIVGVEPSCLATLKDELPNLFPDAPDARRISDRAMMLGDYLAEHSDWRPPQQYGTAKLFAHCNQHAVFGVAGDKEMLERAGIAVDVMDAGCCGMAGSFGFEHDKYAVSQAILNDRLLPEVRALRGARLAVTGFSCREQLRQATGRTFPSLPEVLCDSLRARP